MQELGSLFMQSLGNFAVYISFRGIALMGLIMLAPIIAIIWGVSYLVGKLVEKIKNKREKIKNKIIILKGIYYGVDVGPIEISKRKRYRAKSIIKWEGGFSKWEDSLITFINEEDKIQTETNVWIDVYDYSKEQYVYEPEIKARNLERNFCTKCGSGIEKSHIFCPKCGNKVIEI